MFEITPKNKKVKKKIKMEIKNITIKEFITYLQGIQDKKRQVFIENSPCFDIYFDDNSDINICAVSYGD